ncbi:hypothetical protein ACFQVC_35840 [Streptomyces monticola]|uniref:Endonuclease n=1 Tax=Streptomyces monticola TaxID=2666263 RepID=A0ABW2JWA8_9ACTN
MSRGRQDVVRELLAGHGRTFADEAGIKLRDTPQPLYQLLVLSCLLSARIRSSAALASLREFSAAGLPGPRPPLRHPCRIIGSPYVPDRRVARAT